MARLIKGRVVSTKMDKTAVIAVERVKKHPLYLKHFTRSNNIKIHDEENSLKEGDIVTAKEVKPISKQKKFELVDVVEKSDQIDEEKVLKEEEDEK